MKRTTIAALAGSMLLAAAAHAAPPNPADARALMKLGADNDAFWDAADAEKISSHYAIDGTLRVGDSETYEGRDAVRGYFRTSFANRPAGLHHVSQVDRIDMLTKDVALADAHVRVERANPDGSRTLLREFRNLSVLVREGKAWRFRAIRALPLPPKPATAAAPAAAPAAGR